MAKARNNLLQKYRIVYQYVTLIELKEWIAKMTDFAILCELVRLADVE